MRAVRSHPDRSAGQYTDMQRTLQAARAAVSDSQAIRTSSLTYQHTDVTEEGFGRLVEDVCDLVLEVLRRD